MKLWSVYKKESYLFLKSGVATVEADVQKLRIDSKYSVPISVGEVKGEHKMEDKHAILCDLMKLACFSEDIIDGSDYKGVLGIHVVGKYITQK